jgi:uncharacterized protein YrrD
MTSLRAALGIPVVATSTAEQLGTASGVAVDPERARITAVHVGGSKGAARFVAWEHISSFGADAVMVDDTDAAHEGSGPAEDRVANGRGDILDKRTLSDAGDNLGTVDDLEFDAADGRIQQLQVGAQTIASDRLLGIGSYAVVVRVDDAVSDPPA